MYDREAGASANPRQKVLLVSCLTIVWAKTCFILSSDVIRRVGFRGEMNNKKRKIGLQKQHEAVGSSACRPRRNARRGHTSDCIQRILWPWTGACFDSGRLSQLQWITARGFYWSLANRAVSSEGPNQTHESCCSFSFTRHTSRRLPLEVKRALLWQCHAFRSLHFFSLSGKRNFFSLMFFPCSSCLCTNLPPGQTANQTLMLNDTEVLWAVIEFRLSVSPVVQRVNMYFLYWFRLRYFNSNVMLCSCVH